MERKKPLCPWREAAAASGVQGRGGESTGTFRWRCRRCRLCLAELGPGVANVAYKDLHLVFHGKGILVVRCRRCGELNSLPVDEPGGRAATA